MMFSCKVRHTTCQHNVLAGVSTKGVGASRGQSGDTLISMPQRSMRPAATLKPPSSSTFQGAQQNNSAAPSPLKHLSILGSGAVLAAPFISPAPALSAMEQARDAANAVATTAASSPQFNHVYHAIDDKTMYLGCVTLGGAFSFLTIATTGRFIMSFFPALERSARQARGPIAFRAFVILDGLLGPAQRGLFRMKEEGDVNYAAMMYLAVMSAVLEVLFGSGGLLAQYVPDSELLHSLHYLIFFQQVLLLPQWAMAVFRFFLLI